MTGAGLVRVASRYSVDETVQKLQAAFLGKGMQVFAVIDHSGEAAESWADDASDKGCDLRESEGWDAADGGGSEPGD